jgi:CRISPR system Cascade subunit CasA
MINMETEDFNLIDEPWIPVAGVGLVSLKRIFSDSSLKSLGGNPVQKIAILKLLLAICQAAATPESEEELRKLGIQGVMEACLGYLQRQHDRFYLYGDTPFLQLRAIEIAKKQNYGVVQSHVSTGNTTILFRSQLEQKTSNAEKANILVSLMAFSLGGKKTDNKVVLSQAYPGKTNSKGNESSSKPGPAVGRSGFLHSFLFGESLQVTLFLNIISKKQIERIGLYSAGLGTVPWEKMPSGEDCDTAKSLQQSLLGRLVPLSRFCLLTEDGIHYSEGIHHSNYDEGVYDPSIAVNFHGKTPKVLWVDPAKRPWHELPALLSYMGTDHCSGFQCVQIDNGLDRARAVTRVFGIWSGGLRISTRAGEQYATGSDDVVESCVWLNSDAVGEVWLAQLKEEMNSLQSLAKRLEDSVRSYYEARVPKKKKKENKFARARAKQATGVFWQLIERDFQDLVDHCTQDSESAQVRRNLRKRFAAVLYRVFDQTCPKETGRQLDEWAEHRPHLGGYLVGDVV